MDFVHMQMKHMQMKTEENMQIKTEEWLLTKLRISMETTIIQPN